MGQLVTYDRPRNPLATPSALQGLPPLPAVAQKLLGIVSSDDCPVKAVSRLVETDAAFAAEVLRLANSAVMGMRYPVISVLHAISVLGMDRLRALVVTVAMRNVITAAMGGGLLTACWRHNLATALACERIAETWWVDRSIAYTAGLLHNAGRLALIMLHPEQYARLLADRWNTDDEDLRRMEQQAFGIDSEQATNWIVKDWIVAPALSDSLYLHHGPIQTGGSHRLMLVSIGCNAADRMGFRVNGPERSWEPEWFKDLVPDSGNRLHDRLELVKEEVPAQIDLFESDFLAS